MFDIGKNGYISYRNYHNILKQKLLSALSFLIICLLATACKKDAPIYPGDPDFVPYTDIKSGLAPGNGNPTSASGLNGTWEATSNKVITYDKDMKQTSIEDAGLPMIAEVTINDAIKTANFVGAFGITVDYKYTSAISSGVLQMIFETQPYPILDNNVPVKITNATASAMTWMSIDPAGVSVGGAKVYYGYQTVFRKK